MAKPINCTNTYDELLKDIIEYKDVSVNEVSDAYNLNTCDKFNYNVSIEKKFTYNDVDVCRRVVKSADRSFYKHTYDPASWVVPLLQENTGLNEEQIRSILDLERKEKCCNCIAIVLYSNGNLKKLYSYLYSMKKSLDTVSNELDGFIVRFYLDRSVFTTIQKKMNGRDSNYREESFKILRYMIHHPRSEIVMYFCRDIDDSKKGNIRRFRFLPMIEDDVNILISREADGFVSYEDCHNIRLFARDTEHRIGMIYDFLDLKDSNNFRFRDYRGDNKILDELTDMYSDWLYIYYEIKKLMAYQDKDPKILEFLTKEKGENNYKKLSKYNTDKPNLIEILAGVFGVKVKFQKEYFVDTTRTIREKIEKFDQFKEHPQYKLLARGMDKYINSGFDEILLQELFLPFTSYPYPKESPEIRKESVQKIKNVFVLVDRGEITYQGIKVEREARVRYILNDGVPHLITLLLNPESVDKHTEFLGKLHNIEYIESIGEWNQYIIDLCFSRQYTLNDPYKYYGYAIGLVNQSFTETDFLYNNRGSPIEFIKNQVLHKLFDMMYPKSMIKQGGYIMQRKRTTRRKCTQRKRTQRRK